MSIKKKPLTLYKSIFIAVILSDFIGDKRVKYRPSLTMLFLMTYTTFMYYSVNYFQYLKTILDSKNKLYYDKFLNL